MPKPVYYKFFATENEGLFTRSELTTHERKLLEPSLKPVVFHVFAALGALFYYMYTCFPPITKLVNTAVLNKLINPSYEFSKSHQNTSALVLLVMATTYIAHTIVFYSRKDMAPIRTLEQLYSSKLKENEFTLLLKLCPSPDNCYVFQKNNKAIPFENTRLALEFVNTLKPRPKFIPLEQILPGCFS